MSRTNRNLFLTLFLSFLSLHAAFSQEAEGDIKMEKNFWGVKFYQDSKQLTPKQVLEIMRPNEEAFRAFKKAKSNLGAANVMGFIGGFMVGWPLGTAIAGGEPEWGLAAGGAALILASIPLNNAFIKHSTTAINLYNRPASASQFKPKMHVGFYGTGVRVAVKF
jgi:hypothetical protein